MYTQSHTGLTEVTDNEREIAAERRRQTGCGGGAQLTHAAIPNPRLWRLSARDNRQQL